MAQIELEWYDILSVLFGTTLSIADPITDILTLVEFYRADHKTWFGVGLCFIILPILFFSFISFSVRKDEDTMSDRSCTRCLFGCNPLFPAFMKLRTFLVHLKLLNLWRSNKIEPTEARTNKNLLNYLDDLLGFSQFAVLIEAALESAPQFIIQLYAMVVRQESVSIIQMVSLPVSFLSLAWASSVADEFLHSDEGKLDFSVKDRVLLFVTHLFILSSRLFAVALFTVSYKWLVTIVLILHCTVITIYDIVWFCGGDFLVLAFWFSFCVHWIRDDWSLKFSSHEENGEKQLRRMMLLSNVMFVIENITLILLFYFSHFPHTWYSLPVTICVCLLSVLGAVMRLISIP